MSTILESVEDIQRLCQEVRRLPQERRVDAFNALSRVDYSQYPPELHDTAEDAMFYAVFGVERNAPEDGSVEIAFAESKPRGLLRPRGVA